MPKARQLKLRYTEVLIYRRDDEETLRRGRESEDADAEGHEEYNSLTFYFIIILHLNQT